MLNVDKLLKSGFKRCITVYNGEGRWRTVWTEKDGEGRYERRRTVKDSEGRW
jgi:hypothetical protein